MQLSEWASIATENTQHRGKYHCTSDLLSDWFGFDQTSKTVVCATEAKQLNPNKINRRSAVILLPIKLVFSHPPPPSTTYYLRWAPRQPRRPLQPRQPRRCSCSPSRREFRVHGAASERPQFVTFTLIVLGGRVEIGLSENDHPDVGVEVQFPGFGAGKPEI